MINATELLGQSQAAGALGRSIAKAGPTDASVLLIGESGTGKEIVARAVHSHSTRRGSPFVVLSCGAISPSLIHSELFGHEKGSFTGAIATTSGCFERADGGTLFLDEITDMPAAMQVQMLRVLETGRYHRVGGNEDLSVDVRIIAASRHDPRDAARAGRFRSDLLYRLAVFPLRIPALRERKSDIPYLAQRFLDELNQEESQQKQFSPSCLKKLQNYDWPGNVRELKNTIARAYIMADDILDVVPTTKGFSPASIKARHGVLQIPVGTTLLAAQHSLIMATLSHFHGDRRLTAQALGISTRTLYNRLEQEREEKQTESPSP